MACGRLSYSKVRALSRVASPATEARLLAVACGATAAQVERLVRGWRQADHAAQADGEQVRLASRMLSTQVDDNGMLVLRARLTPEVGADGDEPTIAQRRADALGLVAESALAARLDPGNPGDRFQVTVHVPADTLAWREPPSAPPRLSAETRAASAAASQPVAAAAHAVMEQAGCCTPAGRRLPASPVRRPPPRRRLQRQRPRRAQAPASLRRRQRASTPVRRSSSRQVGCTWAGRRPAALPAMPPSWRCATAPAASCSTSVAGRARSRPPCAAPCWTAIAASASFPGCNSRHCDAHHVVHWADGGETRLQNLVLSAPPPRGARRGLSGGS